MNTSYYNTYKYMHNLWSCIMNISVTIIIMACQYPEPRACQSRPLKYVMQPDAAVKKPDVVPAKFWYYESVMVRKLRSSQLHNCYLVMNLVTIGFYVARRLLSLLRQITSYKHSH